MIKNQDKTPNRETHRERDGKEEKVKDHGPSFFCRFDVPMVVKFKTFSLEKKRKLFAEKIKKSF
jgi:hypothetical protein